MSSENAATAVIMQKGKNPWLPRAKTLPGVLQNMQQTKAGYADLPVVHKFYCAKL